MKKVSFKNGLSGKGFGAALALSICAVGLSAYAAYTSATGGLNPENPPSVTTDDNVFLYPEEDEEVNADKNNVPKDTTSKEDEKDPSEDAGMIFSNPKTLPIADAKVINPYSNGELVKSETLGVWKTHDGVDLAAEIGTAVCSMMKGTVSEVNDDALWGICVIIDHGDQVFGHYYNLSENVTVNVGQEVAMGEVIGQVGNTADIESKLEPHLHFGVTVNKVWTDPIKFID